MFFILYLALQLGEKKMCTDQEIRLKNHTVLTVSWLHRKCGSVMHKQNFLS